MKMVLENEAFRVFKAMVDASARLIDETPLEIKEEGIRMRNMDPAHVCLVDINLKKEAFAEYDVTEDLSPGVDVDRLNAVLKRFSGDEDLTLGIDEEGNNITVRYGIGRAFQLPILDIDQPDLKTPNLDFPCRVKLDPSVFSEAVKDAQAVECEYLNLEIGNDYFRASAAGDVGTVEGIVPGGETMDIQGSETPVKTLYTIEYLEDIIKAGGVADSLEICLGSDIPVDLTYEALNGDARLRFLLAPRIESQ